MSVQRSVVAAVLLSLSGGATASGQLLGDEVSFMRLADNPSGPFYIQYEDATFVVGAGNEYQAGMNLTFDLDASSITITAIADTNYSAADPHEWRFYLAPTIRGFALTTSNFGTLSEADISYSDHVLTVNISGLDPGFPAFARIDLELERDVIQSVPAVSPLGLVLLALALGGAALALLR